MSGKSTAQRTIVLEPSSSNRSCNRSVTRAYCERLRATSPTKAQHQSTAMENMLSTLAPAAAAVGAEWYNTTAVNATAGSEVAASPLRHGGRVFMALVKVVYAVGIVGNAAAIVALRRGERRVRNRKHLLLLTSLAANDLVALVGMMCAMVVSEQVPGARNTRAYCAARVLLRVFGVGSVCIAVTMALERYLALTRPFLYQKQVTYYVIRTALLVSWAWAAALTCAPVLGLGLYYDEANRCCTRYRNAITPVDFAYAVFYVAFGTLLCAVLVYCNLAVIRALYAITLGGGTVRRVSRTSCRRQAGRPPGAPPAPHNAATAEEVAFSRLMATLSVLFMICWLPQMEHSIIDWRTVNEVSRLAGPGVVRGAEDAHICGRSLSAIKVSLDALYSEDVATVFARRGLAVHAPSAERRAPTTTQS
ncbi:Prostacyclin receptor [Papilio xuthus]|uniref:Prostacyclin receptor n=1 Tax=Papilio xuthus TaxID=66420 RepID=A0A194QEQ7_PAPXU|nr:Prostacyclin receptor [Papilio xuthus]